MISVSPIADGLKGSIPNFEAISDHDNPEGPLQEAAQAEFNHLAIQVCYAAGLARTESYSDGWNDMLAHDSPAVLPIGLIGIHSILSTCGCAGGPLSAGATCPAPPLLGTFPPFVVVCVSIVPASPCTGCQSAVLTSPGNGIFTIVSMLLAA
jgi:hypothetical protein